MPVILRRCLTQPCPISSNNLAIGRHSAILSVSEVVEKTHGRQIQQGGGMRLRTRFLLVLAIMGFIMTLAALITSRIVLVDVARRSDEAQARTLLKRGQYVLAEEAAALAGTVADWASWDDAYAFAADRNRRFREVNLVTGTLESLDVDGIVFYDTNRSLVACAVLDSDGEMTDSLPRHIREIVERRDGILDRVAAVGLSGYAIADSEVWLLAASPIYTSRDEGPSHGALVMLRRIETVRRERMARLIDPSLRLLAAAPDWPAGRPAIEVVNLFCLQARVALADVFGKGRLVMEMTLPRVAFGQVIASFAYLCGWIAVCGLGLWLLAVWFLNRWVLRSVTEAVGALRSGIAATAARAHARTPLKKIRDDELGELVEAVEAAIASVEASMAEAIRRREEAVQAQRLVALGMLAAGVAHEINNPNGIVNLNLHVLRRELERFFRRLEDAGGAEAAPLLEERARLEGEAKAVIQEALEASERIAGIVSALKTFAQPAVEGEGEDVAAEALVEEAARWLRHEFQQAHCRLECAWDAPLPALRGNRQQLLQVFINILQNACQAMSESGGSVRVTGRYERGAGTVTIEVADTGRGMTPEAAARSLEPFFTTRREDGGTGLGLSIAAAIVKSHGGRLAIRSQAGQGTVVSLVFPVHPGGQHGQ